MAWSALSPISIRLAGKVAGGEGKPKPAKIKKSPPIQSEANVL